MSGHEDIAQPPLTPEEAALMDEYTELAHAMQAGVAMEAGGNDQTPKHLRVGINAAMCDHAALVDVLVRRGVITRIEYLTALRERMKAEVEMYTRRASERLGGANVKLV